MKRDGDWMGRRERRRSSLTLLLTLVARLQLDLAAVVAMATLCAGPDSEHVGRPRLEAVHCHHVGLGFQDRVVLVLLVLSEAEYPRK